MRLPLVVLCLLFINHILFGQELEPAYITAHHIKTVYMLDNKSGEVSMRQRYNKAGMLTEQVTYNSNDFYFIRNEYDDNNRKIASEQFSTSSNERELDTWKYDAGGNETEEKFTQLLCDSAESESITTSRYYKRKLVWQEMMNNGILLKRFSVAMKDTVRLSETETIFYDTGYVATTTYMNANSVPWKMGKVTSHSADTAWYYTADNGIVFYKQRPGNPPLIYQPVFSNGWLREEHFYTADSSIYRIRRYRANGTSLSDSVHFKTGQVKVRYMDHEGKDSIAYDAVKGSKGIYIKYYNAYVRDTSSGNNSSLAYDASTSIVSISLTARKDNLVTKESYAISHNHGYRTDFSFDPNYYMDDRSDAKLVHRCRLQQENGRAVKEKCFTLKKVKNPRYENSRSFSFRREKLEFNRTKTIYRYNKQGQLIKERWGSLFSRSKRCFNYDKNGLLTRSSEKSMHYKRSINYRYEFYDQH